MSSNQQLEIVGDFNIKLEVIKTIMTVIQHKKQQNKCLIGPNIRS